MSTINHIKRKDHKERDTVPPIRRLRFQYLAIFALGKEGCSLTPCCWEYKLIDSWKTIQPYLSNIKLPSPCDPGIQRLGINSTDTFHTSRKTNDRGARVALFVAADNGHKEEAS